MRTAIAVIPGFGRLFGYEDHFTGCVGQVSDAILNGDLPSEVEVFRLPRRLDVGRTPERHSTLVDRRVPYVQARSAGGRCYGPEWR